MTFLQKFRKNQPPHPYINTVKKININSNHTLWTMQTFNPISFHALTQLNVTWTKLWSLVWFYVLTSWPLLMFYYTHDMSCPRAQNSKFFTLAFYILTVQWSISGTVNMPLEQQSKRKDTEKSLASPFNNTAEQKKDNRKTSHANMQKHKPYSKILFTSALCWSKLSTYTSVKRRNNFYRWIYLNKNSNQISTKIS